MPKGKYVLIIIGAAVLLGALAAGILASRLQQAPARAATTAAVTATITIDPKLEITLAPPPPSATPALSAQQAWLRYAKHVGSHRTTMPSDITARLGLFTLPVGPANSPGTGRLPKSHHEAYTALNQLVYGYSWHSCPIYSYGPGMTPPPVSSTPCIEWLFLDANTGNMIVETWQTYGTRGRTKG